MPRPLANPGALATLACLCTLALGASIATAQTPTQYDLRNNLPGVQGANLRVVGMEDSLSTADTNIAINFTGDGRAVNWLEVYFVGQSSSGTVNGWVPSNMDFRLTGRYGGTASYAADPLNPTGPNDWAQAFDTPSNADWLTPIYTSSGYNVYRGEFLFPVMNTAPGQEYSITWSGYGNLFSAGRLYLLFSNNSAGSFGATNDWRWAFGSSPQSLTAAGAPFPTVAARVGYRAPPCPADLNADHAINTADLTILLGHFGQTVPSGTSGDINADGAVTTADLTALLGAFGTACPRPARVPTHAPAPPQPAKRVPRWLPAAQPLDPPSSTPKPVKRAPEAPAPPRPPPAPPRDTPPSSPLRWSRVSVAPHPAKRPPLSPSPNNRQFPLPTRA